MITHTRPGLTIEYKNDQDKLCTADALSVAIAVKAGKYVYTYISSGGVYTVPADKVVAIRKALDGATYCPWCDGTLNSTPCNEGK